MHDICTVLYLQCGTYITYTRLVWQKVERREREGRSAVQKRWVRMDEDKGTHSGRIGMLHK